MSRTIPSLPHLAALTGLCLALAPVKAHATASLLDGSGACTSFSSVSLAAGALGALPAPRTIFVEPDVGITANETARVTIRHDVTLQPGDPASPCTATASVVSIQRTTAARVVVVTGGATVALHDIFLNNGVGPGRLGSPYPGHGGNLLVRSASDVTFYGGGFTNGTANAGGGASIVEASTLTLDGAYVGSNAAGQGGGVLVELGSTVNVVGGTLFTLNLASSVTPGTGSGGAIAADGAVYCEDSGFADNFAGEAGGAVHALSTPFTSVGCEYTGNTAGSGGAVWMQAVSSSFQGDVFQYNVANATTGTAAGGAILVDLPTSVLIGDGTSFIANEAAEGGAVWMESGTLDLPSAAFSQNIASTAGGALRLVDVTADLGIGGSCAGPCLAFSGNEAPVRGGAIDNQGSAVRIDRAWFWGNLSDFGAAYHANASHTTTIANAALLGHGPSTLGVDPGVLAIGPGLSQALMGTTIFANQATAVALSGTGTIAVDASIWWNNLADVSGALGWTATGACRDSQTGVFTGPLDVSVAPALDPSGMPTNPAVRDQCAAFPAPFGLSMDGLPRVAPTNMGAIEL